MLSLVELLRSPVDILCYHPGVHTLRRESAVVERVMITDGDWRLSEVAPGTAVLAVIPPEGAALDVVAVPQAVARLVEQGVTAIALTTGDGVAFADGIEREAAHRGVPVLVPVQPGRATAERIRSDVVDCQVVVQEAQREQMAYVTRLATELEHRDPENAPDRLTRWLAGEMAREEATAVRVPPSERPPGIITGNDGAAEAYRQVRDGKRPTAHVPGDPHVLLNRTSATRPFDVLVAASPWGWTPHLVDLAQQTARHIVYSQGVALRRQIRTTELAVRVAIIQQLLTGDVAHARRAASGLPSGRITGQDARMAVLECASAEDREPAMLAAEEATGGRALVSGCPAVKEHVLIVLPKQIARESAAVRAMLRPLTEGTGAAVGVSNTMPYWSLAFLYTTARGALATARGAEEGIVVAAGGTTLSGELPQHLYSAWAAAVRAPLARRIPEGQRDMVHVTVVAVAEGTTLAARLLNLGHTTVRTYMETVIGAMGLDHRQETHRAVAQFALTAPSVPPVGDVSATPVQPLASLLAHDGPRRWAETVLSPLTDPDSIGLLATWLRNNAETIATARASGLGRNTVRRRLEKIAYELALPLTDPGGSGLHEVLWALAIRGDLDAGLLPDPTEEDPGPP